MKVVGMKELDFKTKDGQQISGVKLFLEYQEEKTTGVCTDSAFISERRMEESNYIPAVGDDIELMYNRYGKIQAIRLLASGLVK